jgi:hypothetical protein
MPSDDSFLDGEWLARRLSRGARQALFLLITLAAVAATFARPPIVQNPAYNHFADTRAFLGVPYFLDVASNLPILLVGLAGLEFLRRTNAPHFTTAFTDPTEAWPYRVLFAGVCLAAFGSAYYHLAPSDGRLVWDRLPMTIVFMSWLAATIEERIDRTTGLRLLPILVGLGVYSVVYWHISELRGVGDLRVYADVQYLSTLAIPLLSIMFPSRYTRSRTVFVIVVIYLLAKSLELFDEQIFALGHIVSGHTLKHLAAAGASYLILDMLRRRAPAHLSPIVEKAMVTA